MAKSGRRWQERATKAKGDPKVTKSDPKAIKIRPKTTNSSRKWAKVPKEPPLKFG